MRLIILLWFIPLLCDAQIEKSKHIGFSERFGIWKNTTVSYNAAAKALFDRMDVQPPKKLKGVISTMFDTLQAYHIDDSLDFFFYHGMHTSQSATLDWIRTSTTATLVNSPTFTAYEGYTTDGASSYLKTNYNPGTDAVHYRLNSASMGVYIRTNNIVDAKWLNGITDGTNNSYIRLSTTNLRYKQNSAAQILDIAHSSDISGFTVITRTASSTLAYSRNGAVYSIGGNNSGAIPNQANGIYVGCLNDEGSPNYYTANQFLCEFGGGQLTELQKTKIAYIINWAATQYGKNIW